MISQKISDNPPKVADLYCGMGGLSHGFAENGFEVIGVDISKKAGLTYSFNRIGKFVRMDLMRPGLLGGFQIILGGPPCEPWSCLNLTKRGKTHPRYWCLNAYFREIKKLKPLIFIMENVPAIKNDPLFLQNLEIIRRDYDAVTQDIRYSDYGAAFARRRFFTIGIQLEIGVKASEILGAVEKEKASTVREVIGHLRNVKRDSAIDHIWPNLRTIHRYLKYYRTGKYGWYILEWDKPSPSFGNITKTYILHPDSFNDGIEARAISVREALRIVGFPDEYRFPVGLGMSVKYDMIADAVSPVFSSKLAKAVKNTVLPLMAM